MKKKIKIFSVPSHATKERTSGVDFARIIQPSKFLDGYEDDEVVFEVKCHDLDGEIARWPDVVEKHDIIFLNYINNPWGFAAMGTMVQKFNKKIVFDIDDSLWNMKTDNSAYKVYHKGSEHLKNITAMFNSSVVSKVTTTTNYLKNVIMNNTHRKKDEIAILPNYIDLETLYTFRPEFKDTMNINLLHFGSSTHFWDLKDEAFSKGLDKIMRRFPNVTLTTIGAFMPNLSDLYGPRYTQGWGASDVYTWIKDKFPKYLGEADIMVVPLANTVYDRCKSNIKFLEASSAKIPGVWQKIVQYEDTIEDGVTGFLAETADEWYEKLKILIEDTQRRKEMGQKAFELVEKDWTIQKNVYKYAELFKNLLSPKA